MNASGMAASGLRWSAMKRPVRDDDHDEGVDGEEGRIIVREALAWL